MESIGFVTLSEANEIIKKEFGSERWNDSPDTFLSGTIITAGFNDLIAGSGTKFSSETPVNSIIKIGTELRTVVNVYSDISIRISERIQIDSYTKFSKLSADQALIYQAKNEKKTQALWTAYHEIIYSGDFSITADTTSDDIIKRGQSIWALDVFKNSGNDKAVNNLNSGIKKKDVGDLSVEYFENADQFAIYGSVKARQILFQYAVRAGSALFRREPDKSL